MESHNEQKMRDLLERYFEGATSLDEEAVLKNYFSTASDIPADMEYAKPLFGYYKAAAQRRMQTEIVFEEHRPSPRKVSITWWLSAAAVVLVLLVAGIASIAPFSSHQADVICYVNGKPVSDYNTVKAYSTELIDFMGQQMNKSTEYLSLLDQMDRSVEQGLKYLSKLTQ